MTKQSIIQYKLDCIADHKKELKILASLEIGRIYSFKEELVTTTGIIETFNTESIRVRVLSATFGNYYSDIKNHRGDRRNITSLGYRRKLNPVKLKDLPLLIGDAYVSSELHKILAGTQKVKGE
jgi:hypothetical protein